MTSPRGHLEPEAERAAPGGLDALLRARPETVLRAVPGRETFAWPGGPSPDLVLKRYRADLARDRWFDRLHGRPGRSPGRREYENLRDLAADGLPVPRALGWAESPDGTSLVVMERVPHRINLRKRLLEGEPAGPWVERIVPLVARLHELGWYHRDLYLQHWIEGPAGLVLLDAGRARRQRRPRRRWFVKDLAALEHSAPRVVGAGPRLRFLARYLDARSIEPRRERRRWAREVAARARRMAAHLPRHDAPEVGA